MLAENLVNVGVALDGPTTVKLIKFPASIIGPDPLLTDTLSMYNGSKGEILASDIPGTRTIKLEV